MGRGTGEGGAKGRAKGRARGRGKGRAKGRARGEGRGGSSSSSSSGGGGHYSTTTYTVGGHAGGYQGWGGHAAWGAYTADQYKQWQGAYQQAPGYSYGDQAYHQYYQKPMPMYDPHQSTGVQMGLAHGPDPRQGATGAPVIEFTPAMASAHHQASSSSGAPPPVAHAQSMPPTAAAGGAPEGHPPMERLATGQGVRVGAPGPHGPLPGSAAAHASATAGSGGAPPESAAVRVSATSSSSSGDAAPASPFGRGIILDCGTYSTKVGWAAEKAPAAEFPTLVGLPRHDKVMAGSFAKDSFVGHEAQTKRGVLTLRSPIVNGRIQNFDDMEKIYHHAIANELRVNPADHPIMITEAPMSPLAQREKIAEIMFHKFNVPALFVAGMANLSLYGLGLTTGMVVELGHGVCHTVPVVQGYSFPAGILRLDMGGRDITEYLKRLLVEKGYSFTTTAEHEIVEHIKNELAYVSMDFAAEKSAFTPSNEVQYTMPDGQKLNIGIERFQCTESLFNPSMVGHEHLGIHRMIFNSIEKADITVRNELVNKILLGGGTSLFPNIEKRIHKEIQVLAPPGAPVNVIVTPTRKNSVWLGGAALAANPAFQPMWITRRQYEEVGPSCLHNKLYQ
mmetsp:Transcript_18550/g.55647  ORF Transcript_18550/g.55647 Transcript_18550/m.55647 type:complete len:619 (-) Transcript_18550:3-1859(-)|eukprot:CAMPEP_0174237890 /NCGR_PEP_ID=MMETSP0417-20130205/9640_1 /TAXON_ID=242541 /ORGANISM="Mayorella sp, Strain BSH-02190019" /LENGTH=618 /DNA_ID=CAMNT_0015316683 /DNA_START=99 /DNA_END=1955 /DNA_ORIENTATION=-